MNLPSNRTIVLLILLIALIVLNIRSASKTASLLSFSSSLPKSLSKDDDDSKQLQQQQQEIVRQWQQHETFNSTVKFVFTIGLEGTGHHFIEVVLNQSPFVLKLQEMDILQNYMPKLHSLLYVYRGGIRGIWSAFCAKQPVNITNQFHKLVNHLKTINNQVQIKILDSNTTTQKQQQQITYPINTLPGAMRFGMMSYPNYFGLCRPLYYPNLDVLYQACDKAQVDCEHLYIYRDPAQIIASTTVKRDFNPTVMKALQLYVSQLYIIHAQLQRHSSRIAGCHGFYDPLLSHEELWSSFRYLFGWRNTNSIELFNLYITQIFKPPKPMTKQQQQQILPQQYNMPLQSLTELNEIIINTCRQQMIDKQTKLFTNDDQIKFQLPQPTTKITKNIMINDRPFQNTKIKFVVMIGIEGSGHEYISSALQGSQTLMQILTDFNIYPKLIKQLHSALNNTESPDLGLWSAHCTKESNINVTNNFQRVVQTLTQIRQQIIISKSPIQSSLSYITIPVNLVQDITKNNNIGDNFGSLSYPTSLGSCRNIDFPDLNIWYQACDAAQVDCTHVYMYRDPTTIIHDLYQVNKNSNYNFNDNQTTTDETILYGIQLSITQLYNIHGQISTLKSRTETCWNMDIMIYDFKNIKKSAHQEDEKETLRNLINELFGVNDIIVDQPKSTFLSPSSSSMHHQNDILIPVEYEVYMQSLIDAHDQVVRLCHHQKFK